MAEGSQDNLTSLQLHPRTFVNMFHVSVVKAKKKVEKKAFKFQGKQKSVPWHLVDVHGIYLFIHICLWEINVPDNILIFYTPLLRGKHFCNMTHLPFVLFPNMVDQVSLSCSCHLNAALCRVPVKLASDTRVSSVKRPRQPLLTVHLSILFGVFSRT